MNPIGDYAPDHDWCIAGGWAACPQLATDQDIWIFVKPHEQLSELREKILFYCPDITPEFNDGGELSYLYETGFLSLKVGTHHFRHIMVTNAKNPYVLLDGFDISTHQCAILSNGEFIKGWAWTPITQQPRVIKDGGPNTATRLEKIRNRYGMFVPPPLYRDLSVVSPSALVNAMIVIGDYKYNGD